MDGVQTWRVREDEMRDVCVEPAGAWWRAYFCNESGEGVGAAIDETPRRAVACVAANRHWDVREIFAPGEQSAAEREQATRKAIAARIERAAEHNSGGVKRVLRMLACLAREGRENNDVTAGEAKGDDHGLG